jgi:hypothetical protein
MTTQEIKALPTDEKIKIMETIWEDMRDHYESAPVSEEVIAWLRQRQDRVRQGEAKLLEWDSVKFAIGRG